MNLIGGTVNMQVDTAYLGRGQSGNGGGPSTGTLSLGAGMLNANNLNVGYASSSAATGAVTGTGKYHQRNIGGERKSAAGIQRGFDRRNLRCSEHYQWHGLGQYDHGWRRDE